MRSQLKHLLALQDERHAVLELAKLTTDPENHTGEGSFFSSRMFDEYAILSGGVYFSHAFSKPEDRFSGIDQIGQAFADEVFRVFRNKHPDMQRYFSQATPNVEDMIIRALRADEIQPK